MSISASITVADPTFGTFYSQFANSKATIPMGPWFLGRVEFQQISPRATPVSLSNVVVDNGTTVNPSGILNWKSEEVASNWEWDFDAVEDATNESVVFTPRLRMGPSTQVNFGFKSVSKEFRVNVIGDLADCRVLLPNAEGTIAKWSDVDTTETIYRHPGVLNRGGGTGATVTDEPTGDFAGTGAASWSQMIYLWNKTTKKGIIFRFNDTKGRGKGIGLVREGISNDLVVLARWVAQDSSEGNNAQSDEDPFDYGLEVIPFEGTEYHAIKYHLARQKAEGHPAYRKGKLRARSDAHELSAFWAAFNQPADFILSAQLEYQRIASYFNIPPAQMAGIVYGYGEGGMAKKTPFLGPFVNDADQCIKKLHEIGFKVCAYTIPLNPNVNDLPAEYGINSDLVKNRSDQDITVEKIEHPGTLAYIGANWLNGANNQEYLQTFVDEMISGVGTSFTGMFLDAHNAYLPLPNSDSGLSPADRGIGSKTWTVKNAELVETLRTLLINAGIKKPLLMSEWPNEFYIAEFDVCCFNQLHIDSITRPVVPYAAYMWSEYIYFGTFQQFGTGPLHTLNFGLSGWAETPEVFSYYWSYLFHCSQLPSFLAFFTTAYHFITEKGEPGYEEWWLNSQGFFRHLKNWFNKLNLMDHLRKCELIKPLDNSQIVRSLNANLDGGPVAQPVDKVHSSVVYEDTRDIVYVRLSNWSNKEHTPVTFDFDLTLNPSSLEYPELGSQPRDIYVWNKRVEKVGEYDGSTEINLTVTMEPEDVAIVAMPLKGKPWVAPKDENTAIHVGIELGLIQYLLQEEQ